MCVYVCMHGTCVFICSTFYAISPYACIRVCVCVHTHKADEVAQRLFQWWAKGRSNLNHRQIKNQLPVACQDTKLSVAYPTHTISNAADCTGFFTLECQVCIYLVVFT